MRQLITVMAVALVLLPGCSRKSGPDLSRTGAIAEKRSYAGAMKNIYALMSSKSTGAEAKPVDFSAIDRVYRAAIAPLVAAFGQPLAAEIDSAIERGKRGENVPVQKQWLDKGLQQAIYHAALENLDRAPSDTAALAVAGDLLECLGTVMDRRAKWFNAGTLYRDQVNLELSKIAGSSPGEAGRSIAAIKHILEKVYLLSVIWETRGLIAARGKGGDGPAMKKVEGMIYYNIFAPSIIDSGIRDRIGSEWRKDPLDIDVEAIRTGLARGAPELWSELPDSVKVF